ncbi:hypothetical protein LBMAG34_0810 [Candidatus Saccharibacteria bacterium]|nr:hypothetical protein LBMAG34_0810 [Candidatus Saccharibacteria bacterium]
MTNIQPTMENFNQSSKETLDLRPEGHEAATQAAQAEKQKLLAQQAAASSNLPKGMDIKQSPTSKGFNQVPGINSQATGEANVFRLSPSELENPPDQAQSEAAPQTQVIQTDQASTDTQAMPSQNEAVITPPAKKPGFFGKLFGKK